MALFRVAAITLICIQLQWFGTCDQQITCLYKSLNINGKTTQLDQPNTLNISTECKGFCHLNTQTTQGQQNATFTVAFSKSTIPKFDKHSNNLIVITCTFLKKTETNCTLFTSPPTPTEASVSTFWAEKSSIPSGAPEDTEMNTTMSTKTTVSTSTITNDTNFVETKTTMSTETSTANPHYSTTPLQSKTTCTRASSSGAFVGAVLGGAVLGAVITAIAFVVFFDQIPNLRKKCRMTLDRKTNPVYQPGLEDIHLEHIQTSAGQKAENYNEIIEPTHTQDSSLQQHETNSSRKDDVYNHLHETEKGDRSDNYDHAVLGTADGSGYGMVSVDRGINDNYCEVDPTNISSSATLRSKESNPYFTLEAQDD